MFCPTCGKCPQCCKKSACRGQTSKLLENLAKSRGRSEGSSNPARGLPPPLPDPAPTHEVPYSHKPLCQSPQEQLPAGGITSAYRQKRSGKGSKSQISRVSSPKTQQQMEANTGPKQTKPFPQGGKVQNGNRKPSEHPSNKGSGSPQWTSKMPTFTYRYRDNPGNTCDFMSRAGLISSKHCPLVCPQRPWSSLC